MGDVGGLRCRAGIVRDPPSVPQRPDGVHEAIDAVGIDGFPGVAVSLEAGAAVGGIDDKLDVGDAVEADTVRQKRRTVVSLTPDSCATWAIERLRSRCGSSRSQRATRTSVSASVGSILRTREATTPVPRFSSALAM